MIRDVPLSDDEIRQALEAHPARSTVEGDAGAAFRDRFVRDGIRLARRGYVPVTPAGSTWSRPDRDTAMGEGGPDFRKAPHEPAEGEIEPPDMDSPAEIAARRNAAREIDAAAHPPDLITDRVLRALACDPLWPDADATVGAIRHIVATTLEIVREEVADEIGRLRAGARDGAGSSALRPTFVPPGDSANE